MRLSHAQPYTNTPNDHNHINPHRTSAGRVPNRTALCTEGALGSPFPFLSCSRRSTNHDVSSLSCSWSSAGLFAGICRNVSLSHQKVRYSTQILSGHLLYLCWETLLQFSMYTITNETHGSWYHWTFQDSEAPRGLYLCTRVISFAFFFSVHMWSIRCAVSFLM